MVSIVQLIAAVDPALVPVNAAARASVEISGIHISELPDPTPYLDGGEILLTNGMPLTGSAAKTRAYVERLAQHDVRALVLGVGPIHQQPPKALTEACSDAGLPLLLVPKEHPFQTVTVGYWELVAKEGRAGLLQQIDTQTSVVREATGPDGVAAVIRLLSQSLGTWAGCFPFDESESVIFPATAAGVLPALRDELRRFARRGDVGAASFPLHGFDVIAYPISIDGRSVASLVVGTTQRLTRTDRQLILTAAATLTLRTSLLAEVRASTRDIGDALATLLIEQEITAARVLASAIGAGGLPARVRVFASAPIGVASRDEGHSPFDAAGPPATDLVSTVSRDAIVTLLKDRGLVPAASRLTVSTVIDGCVVVLFDADADARVAASTAPVDDGTVTGALSEPTGLDGIRTAVGMAMQTARRATTGMIVPARDGVDESRGEEAAAILRSYTRAPLVESVQGYIRHRGSWENAARELGVHRNTVRSRVRIARETLGIDLDDPDLAAELWIALRESRLGQ